MILSDVDIKEYLASKKLVIDPLSDDTIRENGVDLRIDNEIMRFNYTKEPADLNDKEILNKVYLKEKVEKDFVLSPQERILVKIKEKIHMPSDLVGLCNVRSTFARLGISIPPTVVDAGYEGNLTIMLIGGNVPVRISKDTRFLHLILSKTSSEVQNTYKGTYHNSSGVTGASGITGAKV